MGEIDWVKDAKFDPEKGEINIMGARVVIASIEEFKAFRESMIKIAGPAAKRMIYLAAKEHTEEYVRYMIDRSKLAKLASKTGMGKNYIAEQVVGILTQYGYGKAVIEKNSEEEMIISLENSAIAVQYENSEVPVCSHIAGLIAGGATAIYGRDYDCKEVECIAKGEAICMFVVKPKK